MTGSPSVARNFTFCARGASGGASTCSGVVGVGVSAGVSAGGAARAGSFSSSPHPASSARASATAAQPPRVHCMATGGYWYLRSAMGRIYDQIDLRQREWIARQSMFFVGTAPLDADGHVNVSPKGPIGTLRVLDEHTVAYLDLVGSGAETIAHLRENGRIVVMLCAFDGPPRILRLHGRGEVVEAGDPRFDALLERAAFDAAGRRREPPRGRRRRGRADRRLVRLRRAAHAVRGARPHADAWAAKKVRVGGPDAIARYQDEKNAVSIDGLPALG